MALLDLETQSDVFFTVVERKINIIYKVFS